MKRSRSRTYELYGLTATGSWGHSYPRPYNCVVRVRALSLRQAHLLAAEEVWSKEGGVGVISQYDGGTGVETKCT